MSAFAQPSLFQLIFYPQWRVVFFFGIFVSRVKFFPVCQLLMSMSERHHLWSHKKTNSSSPCHVTWAGVNLFRHALSSQTILFLEALSRVWCLLGHIGRAQILSNVSDVRLSKRDHSWSTCFGKYSSQVCLFIFVFVLFCSWFYLIFSH